MTKTTQKTNDVFHRGSGFVAREEHNTAKMTVLLNQLFWVVQKIDTQKEQIAYLEDLLTKDQLTGLYNRQGFYEAFMREMGRCKRGHSIGGVLISIDVDNFHDIQKRYGRGAGDFALRKIAEALTGTIRPMDFTARLRGDEFVVLLSDTTKFDAAGRVQELGRQLNNLSFIWNEEKVVIRTSMSMRAYSAEGHEHTKPWSSIGYLTYTDRHAYLEVPMRAM